MTLRLYCFIALLMRIKQTDAIKTFLVNFPDMFEDMQSNNYYDEATNKTYTNGFRSIYKYCKKHKFNFREVVLNLYFEQSYIPAIWNEKTEGLEII